VARGALAKMLVDQTTVGLGKLAVDKRGDQGIDDLTARH